MVMFMLPGRVSVMALRLLTVPPSSMMPMGTKYGQPVIMDRQISVMGAMRLPWIIGVMSMSRVGVGATSV